MFSRHLLSNRVFVLTSVYGSKHPYEYRMHVQVPIRESAPLDGYRVIQVCVMYMLFLVMPLRALRTLFNIAVSHRASLTIMVRIHIVTKHSAVSTWVGVPYPLLSPPATPAKFAIQAF